MPLEDPLRGIDVGGALEASRERRQRIAHAVGAMIIALLVLAGTVYTAVPGLAHRLLHAARMWH